MSENPYQNVGETKTEAKGEAKGDGKDQKDDMPKEDTKCTFFGHKFHWSEFFFFAMCGVAVVFFIIPSVPLIPIIACAVYAAVGGIAIAFVWNLASIKRIAAAAEMLEADVRAFKAENERAQKMQGEKRKQDAEMKAKVADLQKAELILKGSVNGLEDIQKQENEMLKEREELLKQRRTLAAALEKDMADLWKSTIEAATQELSERAELYFAESDVDGNGITVGSDEWKRLSALMEKNGIHLDPKAAGDDGNMDQNEFEEFLEKTLKIHFTALEQALRDSEKIQAAILDEKMKRL